jgi:hypothetical protein
MSMSKLAVQLKSFISNISDVYVNLLLGVCAGRLQKDSGI